ncbi:MAG: GNAT family N-acetyltransferase [Sphaerospermopsis sp. SIO1G2]|nr:GNAT family N-acetyltransferase [Sphaerospermopsis sp. SIO1G2]
MSHSPNVTLREITADTVRTICNLDVTAMQKNFVAPNAVSIAQAYFEPQAWFRAIYAGDTAVGFLMTFEAPDRGFYYLWRFMIDHRHQGQGYAQAGLSLLIERIKTRPNATKLKLSVVPENGRAIRFYESMGFVATGEIEHDEHVYELDLK